MCLFQFQSLLRQWQHVRHTLDPSHKVKKTVEVLGPESNKVANRSLSPPHGSEPS